MSIGKLKYNIGKAEDQSKNSNSPCDRLCQAPLPGF